MIIFRNYQWGAEKRNTTLWFKDNFVGTELDTKVSYAKMADACGFIGTTANSMDEVMLNQELGEPFRRDAMKAPVPVAGISKGDMKAAG